jgi:hypothetical protein
MATLNDLEMRVATLERKFADVERLIKRPKKEKDWRATVGMFKDDPYFEEIVELGRQWREEENRKSLEELE